MNKSSILLTGGAGFVGSHVAVQLLEAGFHVIILDNLCNSHIRVIERIEKITQKKLDFIQGDIRDLALLNNVFSHYQIHAVMHFAGLKAVGEAEKYPWIYYDNNVQGSLTLLNAMANANVFQLVFSSSATVYGDQGYTQYTEETPLAPNNVYGRTKRMIEQILLDFKQANAAWRIAILRYFNPTGAHYSGFIGECPQNTPNNLMPYIAQVAIGRRERLPIFGNDFPTPDGTGMRDYIHVDDLAKGHLQALISLPNQTRPLILNLGTGRAYSVLELLRAFEKVSGQNIPYHIESRRSGDVPACYADPRLANQILGWHATHSIERMCQDVWRWQTMNPGGYSES